MTTRNLNILNEFNVLYLEDDEALAFVTKRALKKRDYEVIHFSDIETLLSSFPIANIFTLSSLSTSLSLSLCYNVFFFMFY